MPGADPSRTADKALRPDAVHALVSVHDVMPETLGRVQRILDLCAGINQGPLTLLVVPGLDWDQAGVDRLRSWQSRGHRLAGHGWFHRVERFSGLAHRLHGLIISRRVAEHLALERSGITELVGRCHAWFPARGLTPPELYVPPAWALGAIRTADLAALPFARYEVLTGVRDAVGGRLRPIPMVGYETDTRARVPLIRLWNSINRRRAAASGWLRIAIHPKDPELRLGSDLREDLRRYTRWTTYAALTGAAP
ncbi:MAG: polysaccharide deacetylase family protein [Pseudomonadota bacterium]|nr:polysaccharide deacetylase family protein [Pseudomonadota bacterium]